jgi:hypothetical protein
MSRYDLWRLASPPDDDSGDVAYCEQCSELTPRDDLDALGNCEACNDHKPWSWRDEPLENMSLMQLETLAAEGNAEAAEIVREHRIKSHAYWNPLAERTDNYGRVKTTGAW